MFKLDAGIAVRENPIDGRRLDKIPVVEPEDRQPV
jgi:hypothetical protein